MGNPRLPIWPLCNRSLQSILGSDTKGRGTPEAGVPWHDVSSPMWKGKLCSGIVSWVWYC